MPQVLVLRKNKRQMKDKKLKFTIKFPGGVSDAVVEARKITEVTDMLYEKPILFKVAQACKETNSYSVQLRIFDELGNLFSVTADLVLDITISTDKFEYTIEYGDKTTTEKIEASSAERAAELWFNTRGHKIIKKGTFTVIDWSGQKRIFRVNTKPHIELVF
jgi:hypothetical protein